MVVSPLPITERETRDAAVAELLRTEAIYVSDMKVLVDVFLVPLEGWAADMEALRKSDPDEVDAGLPHITQEDIKQIFANAKQLETFNRQFLYDLRKALGGPGGLDLDDGAPTPAMLALGNFWNSRARHSASSEPDMGHWGGSARGGGGSVGRRMGMAPAPALTCPNLGAVGSSRIEDDPFASSMVKADHGGGGSRGGDGDVNGGGGVMVPVDPADIGPRRMLDVFLESAPFLKMYAAYVNNFERALERLSRLEREKSAVAAFFAACERQRQCRGMRLRDFLVQPVQRIPRYRLLLETILDHTSIESRAHTKVQESLRTMSKIAAKVNGYQSLQQQRDKIHELQQEFGGIDFSASTRLFVKEGSLTKVGRSGPERLHVVLFNDLLVYGQAKRRSVLSDRGNERGRQLYSHRREVDLSKCFLVDAPSFGTKYSSLLGETGMLIVSEEKAFVLLADTPAEKNSWVQAIRLCMRDLWLEAEALEKDYPGNETRSPVSSSAHGPLGSLIASAPRSVWVPSRDGSKNPNLVDFILPAWAGLRRSYGCLSYTELDWGKDAHKVELGAGSSLADALSVGPTARDVDLVDSMTSKEMAITSGLSFGDPSDLPRQVSILVSMTPSEQLGLRLRDVHPGCGGGVMVVGFEPGSPAQRAGVQQGDRITRVDGVAAFKGADISWALSQQCVDPDLENGRTVHLSITRGFAKTEQPWMPPLQPPLDPLASPASSALETLNSDDDIPEVMSAPGSRTLSGDGAAGRRRGFGESNHGGTLEVKTVAAATAAAALAAAVGATRAPAANGSPRRFEKGVGRNSGDTSAGQARRLGLGSRPTRPPSKLHPYGIPIKPLSKTLPSALAACWTCQTDDPFQMSDEDRSICRPPGGLLKAGRMLPMSSVCGGGADDEADDDDDDDDSAASTASSLFLDAVSPSRVPPPLISMASTLPPPPVSLASSVGESFSKFSPGRTWYSPSASQAETPDTSMSWLKPLPPPPPRKSTEPSFAPSHSPPAATRHPVDRSYSCRWAQTPPPLGEPKISPPLEVEAEDRSAI